MKNIYKSIVISIIFGNSVSFAVVAWIFPWNTYLIDPTPYYIVQAEGLGLLIATCMFIYEWAKYGEKPKLFKIIKEKEKKSTIKIK